MGRIVMYIIYFLIAIAVYVLIRAAFFGKIDENTTIGELTTTVTKDSAQTIKDIGNTVQN